MKKQIILGVVLCSNFWLNAQQLAPTVTDRPQVYDRLTETALFLNNACSYFQKEQLEADGDTKVLFGYAEAGARSPIQVSLSSDDSTRLFIRTGRNEDYQHYRFSVFKVNAGNGERQVVCGYKKGITWVYEPLNETVPIRVSLVRDNLIVIRFLADELSEYALFFGPMQSGVPKYKMFTFGIRAVGYGDKEFD